MSYHQRSLSGVTGRVYGRTIVPRGLAGDDAPYGYCPICGSPGVLRGKCGAGGSDQCARGHWYPSAKARPGAPAALSGVTGRVYGQAVVPRSSYVAMGADQEPEVDLSETDWRRQMLAYNKTVADKAAEWVIQDRQIRYLQLAATLAIPLTGIFWKWFLGRRAGAKVSETVTGA